MYHRKKFRKLSRPAAHRKLMLANLVKELFEHGKVDTTVAKAKESARLAEKVITIAKRGDTAARRLVFSILQDKVIVEKLFVEIAPKFNDRNGGYTRVLKLPPRLGDGAERARLTLVESSR